MSHEALLDKPIEYKVARVELKKTLEPKNPGEPAPQVVKLGLIAPDVTKVWPAEFYAHTPERLPKEGDKETLVLTDSQYGLNAKRPGKSGGGFRPGGRSPADTKAIQRQHSQEMSLRYLTATQAENGFTLEEVKECTDWFEQDISS